MDDRMKRERRRIASAEINCESQEGGRIAAAANSVDS